jgi:hypothetical protein
MAHIDQNIPLCEPGALFYGACVRGNHIKTSGKDDRSYSEGHYNDAADNNTI